MDLPFNFIARAPVRYMFYDNQILHPIAIVQEIVFGLSPNKNPSFSYKFGISLLLDVPQSLFY
jgi:hypothetical protein